MNMYGDRLFELMKELSNSSLKYVICGGVACVLHGVERSTLDIDISVDLDQENLKKIIKIAKKFDLKPRNPEPIENLLDENKRKEWIEKKGALVYTLSSLNDPLQIDIFLKYDKTYDELLKNSDRIIIDNIEFLVSSKEDLLNSKKKVKPLREKDKTDIKELQRIINEEKRKKN
jgi:hypothetical protein